MEAATRFNPSGAKSSNGMLPKMLPARWCSASTARDKIFIAGRHSKNGYLFASPLKSNQENTTLKKKTKTLLFFQANLFFYVFAMKINFFSSFASSL